MHLSTVLDANYLFLLLVGMELVMCSLPTKRSNVSVEFLLLMRYITIQIPQNILVTLT